VDLLMMNVSRFAPTSISLIDSVKISSKLIESLFILITKGWGLAAK
jgi:hypothetical protein